MTRISNYRSRLPKPKIHAPTIEQLCLMRKGKLIAMPGYAPCRVLTGNINSRGDVLVEFDGRLRTWFPAAQIAHAIAVYEGRK